MAVSRTFSAKTITWNSQTWDSSAVGPLSVTLAHSGTPVISRTGADLYPRRISVQDRTVVVTVVVGEFKRTDALSGKSTMVVTVWYEEGAEAVVITIPGIRFYEARSTQNRANPSETALSFVHESTDGTTNPIS